MAIGTHVVADLYGVDADLLCREELLVDLCADALAVAGFHVLETASFTFPGPQSGVSAIFLLSESHLALHSYPEHGYLALDLFACGRGEPRTVVSSLATSLTATKTEKTIVTRGQAIRRAPAEVAR